jgi:putative membrane protein
MNTRITDDQEIFAIERPASWLMVYYVMCCLVTGPLFPIFLAAAWFRYHTMRYRFDADGVSMRWGVLFRREIMQVRTAGGGSAGGDGQAHAQNATATHVGHFHGVDNAPAIRDLIMARMKQARDAGLGDPDDNRPTSETGNPRAQIQWQHFRSAVAEVRAESKRLRQMVVSAGGWREGEAPPNPEIGWNPHE